MSRIVLDIDDPALVEAMKEYRIESKVDAVNRALREVAERQARKLREASETWNEMAADMADTNWDEAWLRSQ